MARKKTAQEVFAEKFDGINFSDWAEKYLHEKWDDYFASRLDSYLQAAIQLCESPIERRMLAGLLFCPFGYANYFNEVFAEEEMAKSCPASAIIPQWIHPKLNYRVDFLISLHVPGSSVRPRFIIECDGHDFHERTKEQAARDRKRDRDFSLAGVPFLRFTGSELVRDLDACVDQADSFGSNLIEEVFRQMGRL